MAFSKLEKVLLLKLGIDVVRSPVSRKVAYSLALAAARVAAPATVPLASALGPFAPIAAGAGLGALALQTDPGQQLLAMAEERGRADRIRFEQALTNITEGTRRKVAKKRSSWNRSIAAGMKAVRLSTSYGKKGTINNMQKALAQVTKAAAKVKKTGKVEKQGIKRKIGLAVRRFFGKGGRLA